MNYVASGFQGYQEIILKLSLNEDLIRKEYIALTALADHGAVENLNYKPKTIISSYFT